MYIYILDIYLKVLLGSHKQGRSYVVASGGHGHPLSLFRYPPPLKPQVKF